MKPKKEIKKLDFVPKKKSNPVTVGSDYHRRLAELLVMVESLRDGLEDIQSPPPPPKKKNIFVRFFSNLKYILSIICL